jgi:hypothetical protein
VAKLVDTLVEEASGNPSPHAGDAAETVADVVEVTLRVL